MSVERPRAVVVVAYGRPDLLDGCLATVAGETVVVVDNSSSPQVAAVARAHDATYLDPGVNLGFAGGVNRGLAEAGPGHDVLLLNPDARLDPGAFDRLQATLAGSDRLAAVAPSLAGTDGAPQRVGWPFPSPGGMWREALGLGGETTAGFVVGAVLLLRAEALADVGGFDERYFLYAEEADWQRRAIARGWSSAEVPRAHATHVGGASSEGDGRQQELFHAGQETYVRRWWGRAGWTSYRAAAVAGAGVRAVVLPGGRGRTARRRLHLYLRGPVRAAGLDGRPVPTGPAPLRITHVVVTAAAAGTERQVALTATTQFRAGHDVMVVGGDQAYLAATLPPGVVHVPGATPFAAARALAAAGRRDVVHAHLTTADLVAAATQPLHGATVVSTRHIARTRGSTAPARVVVRWAERRIACEIAISDFVATAVGRDATVVHNAVAADDREPDPRAQRVLVAQRLEPEKATALALRAWAASGAAASGWRLAIAGDGSERAELEDLVRRERIDGVEFLGWVPDARDEMVRSSALLATAPGEPFGLTVVEAMSLGLPVVAAAGGGHLETVGTAPDTVLFTPGDVDAAAAALRAVTDLAPDDLVLWGKRLRDEHRKRFDPRVHGARLEQIYRAVGTSSGYACQVPVKFPPRS